MAFPNFDGAGRNAIAKEYRVNERIRVPQVRVIDERGEQFGVMAITDALALAREHDLDLVEVAPNSDPPVCRLLDYGKFRYLQSTKEREMRKSHKNVGLREVRFRPRIGRHDIEAKERLVLKLLDEGNKVKVSVMHRGRELDHRDLSVGLLKQVHEAVKEGAKLEQPPKQEGRFISIVLAPGRATSGRSQAEATKETEPDAEDETHKGAARRFRVSGSGKLLRMKRHSSHLRRKKPRSVTRTYSDTVTASASSRKKVMKLVPGLNK